MLTEIVAIIQFIIDAFWHIWPYLLVTIPLAVAVQMSGAANYINRAFAARPVTAIFLATAVGAFSPFCSCSVIPVVASLLIGGVPLAPVMAFWVASPSMDPETFFLSVATIGWELAIWRVIATLALSLAAGFITHYLMQRGWLGRNILRTQETPAARSQWELLKAGWQKMKGYFSGVSIAGLIPAQASLLPAAANGLYSPRAETGNDQKRSTQALASNDSCGSGCDTAEESSGCDSSCGSKQETTSGASCQLKPPSFRQRLFNETWQATGMVIKFMLLAFFLEALIIRYVPPEWIAGLLGAQNPYAILTAALIGVPVYTSNLAALPMISGLLAQGMSPAAGLAFLIAGPTTTLPAMAAVWGLTTRRVFALYVSFSLVGAIVLGYVHSLISIF